MSAVDLRTYTTERLSCEALTPDHADEIAPLLWDVRVAHMLAVDRRPPAWGATRAELAVSTEHWREFGFGLWLLRDRRTGAMVGRGGLQHTLATGTDEIEVAWAIVPDRWRQGLATEIALACMSTAFGQLGLRSVSAYTRPENLASRGVMKKAGMSFEREFTDRHGLRAVLYRRSARPPRNRPRDRR